MCLSSPPTPLPCPSCLSSRSLCLSHPHFPPPHSLPSPTLTSFLSTVCPNNGGAAPTTEMGQSLLVHFKVEIWCRNTPHCYTIHHDGEQVYKRLSSMLQYVLGHFAEEQQGNYRCSCVCQGDSGNWLNLVGEFSRILTC